MSDQESPAEKWSPGAWTAARCAHWRQLEGAARNRFMEWVHDEGWQGKCHPSQLPGRETVAA
ncbi:hypothetical protein JCM17960_26130 [Magnetospira thiophila]